MDSYKILVNGVEAATISANFAQASCAIELNGKATPYQVADAKHDPDNAAELLNGWCFSEGGEIWGDDDQIEVVECD
jgi:hypothetical protein